VLPALYYTTMKGKTTHNNGLLPRIDLGRGNLILFLIGLLVLAIGFILMSIGPWDNPLSRSVAPLVLLFGYLIVFPAAIFYRRKSNGSSEPGRSGKSRPSGRPVRPNKR